jgi:DNA-binding response OmpR family regulator
MASILIVDTHVELRGQLVRALELAGNRARAVATVSQAAQILAAGAPDLLATDAILTDGSSTSLAQQAEALGTKTLIMTGNPDRIVEFDGAGQSYLSKPFPVEAFVQRVQESWAPFNPRGRMGSRQLSLFPSKRSSEKK